MPIVSRALALALSLALAGCVFEPAPTSPGTPTVISAGGLNPGATQNTDQGPLGDPVFPDARVVPNRAGELKGLVRGPKLGLIAQYAKSVTDAPTEGLLAAQPLTNLADNFQALAGVRVEMLDDSGNVVGEAIKSSDTGAYSFKSFLPATKLLFVRASYTEATYDVSLLAAAYFPSKAEVAEIELTPATTLVGKKALEMVRLRGIEGDKVPAAMIKKMGETISASMNVKSVVAAAMLPDGKAADAFDAMVAANAELKTKLTAIATEAGALAFLNKTPISRTNVSGRVYDEGGVAVTGATKVRVKSLSTARPYDKTVDLVNGSFTAADAPSEVQLEITVSKDGWTTRQRVEVMEPTGQNQVDFGGSVPGAEAYFISNHPEIVAISPEEGAAIPEPGKLSYKLTLSEPLDAANQNNFALSLYVIPANSVADNNPQDEYPASSVADLAASELSLTKIPYSFNKEAKFLDSEAVKADVSWDTEGKVATLSFNAPLITGKDEDALYNVAFFNRGVEIKDKEGARFGTDKNGSFIEKPALYGIWCGTFKDESFALANASGGAGKAWLATHHIASSFRVPKDTAKPQLMGFSVTPGTQSTRIAFTFDEPIAAFAGGKYSKTTLVPYDPLQINFWLANITFVVGDTVDKLSADSLDGATSLRIGINGSDIANPANWGKEFYFVAQRLDEVELSVDPQKPNVLRLDLSIIQNETRTAFMFPSTLKYIKVRLAGLGGYGGVSDPAGNAWDDADANVFIQTGSL